MEIIKIFDSTERVPREAGRKNRSGFASSDVIGGPETWNIKYVVDAPQPGYWKFSDGPLNIQLVSNAFELVSTKLYAFRLEINVIHAAPFAMVLVSEGDDPSDDAKWIRYRGIDQGGDQVCGFSFGAETTGRFQLALINYFGNYVSGAVMSFRNFSALEVTHTHAIRTAESEVNTYLAHWGPLKRYIHRRCKQSRMLNAFVAGVEMRLGREESLSLPMYLALCPTGQCNALCDFCSVTIKRTGIIKKQLPFEKLQRFLEPTLNTTFMYGVEGNGEPTLYKEFNSLLATLQAKGAASYLITNGALIEPEQISHLLTLQSITFSLNAATAETHNRVMKLKEFDRVVSSIRALVDQRGMHDTPCIFVSFVVHATNAHELQQFLQFAEYDLRVNVIMVRPLSELGVDSGAVEDLREIVPYECQVQDALDAAREYLDDIPRRAIPHTRNHCDIRLDPTTFRSVRPDPVDRVIMPPGFEDRLLAPRRDGWRGTDARLVANWKLNTATIDCPAEVPAGAVWQSVSTPVTPGHALSFRAGLQVRAGALTLAIRSVEGILLASTQINAAEHAQTIELNVQTGDATRVEFEISHAGTGFVAEIDFFRLLTPGAGIRKEFKLPFPRRWQIDTPGVKARWVGNALSINAGANLSGRYLFKSYSSPCSTHARLQLPVNVTVKTGTLVIGILSDDFQKWTHQFVFETGAHTRDLALDTENNQRLQVVIFPRGNNALDACIDWGESLELPPDREKAQSDEIFDVPGLESADTSEPVSTKSGGTAVPLVRKNKPAKVNKIKFYCQKPWTDINNFTVDGRMDVCCITTGASQEHYALGNILEQDFQEVWNGEQMREFRRTVNSDTPLPPCQRCPMAYGYQGPFFDRHLADSTLKQVFLTGMENRHPLRRIASRFAYSVMSGANALFFRGFKR